MENYRRWASEPLTGPPVVSVVIPAYNEEWRIVPTIGAIASHMSSRRDTWELIVADDGSTDTTCELIRELGLVNLRLLEAEENGGKGSAVRRGMLAARGDYVLFADADQSTPIEQFDLLLEQIVGGAADVVVGSRSAEGADVAHKSPVRKIFSAGLNTIVRRGFGLDLSDTQCGFKLFTADAAHRLFHLQQIDGFSFDLEILYIAQRLGMKIAEVPVGWVDAPGSTVDAGKVALRFFTDFARIRIADARGIYRRTVPARARDSATGARTAA